MNIIQELSKNSIKEDKQSTIAIRLSILIAVTMIGTLLFIFSEIDLSEWTYNKEHLGDYGAILFQIDEKTFNHLKKETTIKTLGLSLLEEVQGLPFHRLNAELLLQSPKLFPEKNERLIEGEQPKFPQEIMVSRTFIQENPTYALGSLIDIKDQTYTICGIFEDRLQSFATKYLFWGVLPSTTENRDFSRYLSVDVAIWFRSERDTYYSMRDILADLGQDEAELIKKGGLMYNTSYLEGKLIFRPILRPSSEFRERWSLRVIILGLMLMLFVVMIYNAFNVWNDRDLKEIGLLKSSGMTKKQVKNLVLSKATLLSIKPIFYGLLTAYLFANLLFFLLWLNNKRFHLNVSVSLNSSFRFITPNPLVFIFLIVLAFVCVIFAALKPAIKSSRLSVIDAIKNIDPKDKKLRLKKVRYGKNISYNLAKEYMSSYRHTYRGLALAMSLSAMLLTTLMISQAHRSLVEKYDKPDTPYTLVASFLRIEDYPKEMMEKIREIPGIKSSHIFSSYDFNYSSKINPNFLSKEMQEALKDPKLARSWPRNITLYGLENQDFQQLLDDLKLNPVKKTSSPIFLLDKTAKNPRNAYKFRNYIPLANPSTVEIHVIDPVSAKEMIFPILGRLENFPYTLRPNWPEQIALFTSLPDFEHLVLGNHWINEDQPLVYRLMVEAPLEELPYITDEVKEIVYQYIPKDDVFLRNRLSEMASLKEQTQNELVLMFCAQILFIIIGCTNAYNSFHANLKARSRDFALLRSVGITEKQLKSMLYYEGWFLVRRVFSYYLVMYIAGIIVFAKKKWIQFTPWQLAKHVNYWILGLFFVISTIGIILAIESGKQRILRQRLLDNLQERSY